MDLTIQILTKNNQSQIVETIESLKPLEADIVVNDLASKDKTVALAEKAGARITYHQSENRSEIRNRIVEESTNQWQMFVEPGEVIIKGFEKILANKKDVCYFSIITQGVLRKEIRFWNKEKKLLFKNPIFEFIDCNTAELVPVFLNCDIIKKHDLKAIQRWQEASPTHAAPYYYEALTRFSQGDIEGFMHVSEQYAFMEKNKTSISATMNRYYYALANLHQGKVRATLQNVNLCLCSNPLMAEFWCLIGDVYYHLLKEFDKAASFYQNAIILGSRRLNNDKWPMEIAKYNQYPQQMITSCKQIKEYSNVYAVAHNA